MSGIDWASAESFINQKDANWEKRSESLQMFVDRLAKRDKYAMEMVCRNSKGIALQLNDLRSALVRLASLIIEQFSVNAEEMGGYGADRFGEALLKEPNFIKAIGSANKVINNHAASAFRALCERRQVGLAALEAFYLSNKDSKNNNIRERIAEGLSIYAAGLGDCADKQLRAEGADFLRRTIDVMIKDASGPVRAYAKLAKESLEGQLKDSGNRATGQLDRDKLKHTKTVTRSIEPLKSKDSHSVTLDQKQTIPVAKKIRKDMASIENDETVSISNAIATNKKTQQIVQVQKIAGLLDILESSDKSVKEKLAELSRYDLAYISCPCTIEDYKRFLRLVQAAKNPQLESLYSSLIEGIDISKITGKLLAHAEAEKLHNKESCSGFIAKLLTQHISSFVDYFLQRNNLFALRFLILRFDLDEFDAFIDEKPDVVPSLLTIICQNMVDDNTDSFLKHNASMLEHMYQSGVVLSKYKNYQFSEEF